MYAASALAGTPSSAPARSVRRSRFSSEHHVAAMLLGGIAHLLAPMPFLFYRIRGRSSFAPCTDLKAWVPQVGGGSGEGATGCGVMIE